MLFFMSNILYEFKPNTIYCGDNLKVLLDFPSNSVDLIYIDPPFFTSRNYEIIWGDEQEKRMFNDVWKIGIQTYKSFMRKRIQQLHRVLKPTGSFYLHCDYHANAHLRIICDRIFGDKNFGNEIVWCYSGGGIPKKHFPRKHDIILRYIKDKDAYKENGVFNTEYKDYKENTQQVGKHSTLAKKYGSIDIDLDRGTPVTDWWDDIKTVTGWSPERLGYPTQKPEALLERIIKVSSNPTDIVLDAFCGCGTTLAAAQSLGRRWIGIDFSHTACMVMAERIDYPISDIIGMPVTMDDIKEMKPFDFQNWACRRVGGVSKEKKVADDGIDGYVKGVPIEIKQHSVGSPDVKKFITAIQKDPESKSGIIVGYRLTKGGKEDISWASEELGINIKFIPVNTLLRTNGK